MPQLILVRHAKAEGPAQGLLDHDRALTLEGRTSASQLATELTEAGLAPDAALVSSAVRALQTWKLMESVFDADVNVTVSEDVYETSIDGLVARLIETGDSAQTLVVVGHEPTISATAAWLAGEGSETTALQRVAHGLPTGTAARLSFDGAWADLCQRCAQLTHIYSSQAHF